MKILRTDNQLTFGIRCINSKSWNPELLKNFEKSKLVNEINIKYPKASANHFLFKQNDLGNDEDIWTMLFYLALTPKKIWRFHLDSHNKNVPDKHLVDKINELSLNDLEAEIEKQKNKNFEAYKINITIKKQNPVIEFFKRIFRKDN